MATAPRSNAFGGTLGGKLYVNKDYGKKTFGGLGHFGGNPRAGMSYSLGLDKKGNVVHIYRDGERIVMHTHAPNAAPPHPNSFGGMQAPAAPDSHAQDVAALNLANQLASQHAPHPDNIQVQQANQLALQAALAKFNGA